jgi:hypothetical protein
MAFIISKNATYFFRASSASIEAHQVMTAEALSRSSTTTPAELLAFLAQGHAVNKVNGVRSRNNLYKSSGNSPWYRRMPRVVLNYDVAYNQELVQIIQNLSTNIGQDYLPAFDFEPHSFLRISLLFLLSLCPQIIEDAEVWA